LHASAGVLRDAAVVDGGDAVVRDGDAVVRDGGAVVRGAARRIVGDSSGRSREQQSRA
jgi:hypothetical protein